MTDEVASETPVSEIALFKSGGEPAKAAPAETPKGEEAAPPAVQRDEQGKFKAKEAEAEKPAVVEAAKTEVAATEVKTEAKPTGVLAALLAERQKRQELERKLAEREQTAEKPDIFTDPEKAVKALVDQQVAPIRTKFFNRSLADAQQAHTDFNDAAENFSKLIDSSPALLAELQQADDPGEYIYLIGSNTPEFRQAREAKHRETVSAKDAEIVALKAQVAALEGAKQARESVPESLNRQPSGAVPEREGDSTDISKIVRFKSG